MSRLAPLPCPFCGALPAVHPKDPDTMGKAWGTVRCENKRCPARPVVENFSHRQPKTVAVKRWNRRAM